MKMSPNERVHETNTRITTFNMFYRFVKSTRYFRERTEDPERNVVGIIYRHVSFFLRTPCLQLFTSGAERNISLLNKQLFC